MKVSLPGGIIIDIESTLPFLGPAETHPVGLKTPNGLVKCPGKVGGCCGLRQSDNGEELHCGLTGDQGAAGDINRCYKEVDRVVQEFSQQSGHPETSEG